ncbi:MAG: 5-amino-6-(D-ribitylamino)uracil--L-tyrosine 4-hydroxyphenyl transferase CofH [Ectothiorhodospiraceae bacterium AqS1]|nr:5-amino-6-(D-ribitylamino)uracil--L-tyrosine 4-hydroxyphenyl transferase CofH [Ectothiorhodospiraceae bacterium AqS1]
MKASDALALADFFSEGKQNLDRAELGEGGSTLAEEFPRDLSRLMEAACELRTRRSGDAIRYSPKVFIPLTRLCRDVCHYCTFATTPSKLDSPYLSLDAAIDIARRGARAGCTEALFTLGDRPELRYRAARKALTEMGFSSTIDYLVHAAKRVHEESGLLPHVNPGLMSDEELARLRRVCVSAGLMLESTSRRLCEKGGPHYGSPDKDPARRLDVLERAGRIGLPFTTGILVGIGETRLERIESLLAIRDIDDRHRHIQEVIVQNFRAKAGTLMAAAPEPSLADHRWTIAMARLIFGPRISVQAPPNLRPGTLHHLLAAGLDDWGGVSPLTPDHVNPERAWPHLSSLERITESAGKSLVPRLALHPEYVRDPDRWIDPGMRRAVLAHSDGEGFAREALWYAGSSQHPPAAFPPPGIAARRSDELAAILSRSDAGEPLGEDDIVALFSMRGGQAKALCEAADRRRRRRCGDEVGYVVNRNINYTNICTFKCRFCAFSKGAPGASARGAPYDLDLGEIARRTHEAWERGATEICLQGGIHPAYDGKTYLAICRAVKEAAPDVHIHAFSPLEIWQGARSSNRELPQYLESLREAGLGSLPGTAAEILDDEVRRRLCPDKIRSAQWLEVMRIAHRIGLKTTSTIMFGHLDRYRNWARHLIRLRELAARSRGFTEFVPLPFVHEQSPLYLRGDARPGPTLREAILMHAVARLVLDPHIVNIQASWVKLGPEGMRLALAAGANDAGGTLMNESITLAAGADFGQEMAPERMESIIEAAGRIPVQRTTLYAPAPEARRERSFAAPALTEAISTPALRSPRQDRLGKRSEADPCLG